MVTCLLKIPFLSFYILPLALASALKNSILISIHVLPLHMENDSDGDDKDVLSFEISSNTSDDSWWTAFDAMTPRDDLNERALSALFAAVEVEWLLQPMSIVDDRCDRDIDDTEAIHVYLELTSWLEDASEPECEVPRFTDSNPEPSQTPVIYRDDEEVPNSERTLFMDIVGMDTEPLWKVLDMGVQDCCGVYVISPTLERSRDVVAGQTGLMPFAPLIDDLQACMLMNEYSPTDASSLDGIEAVQAYCDAVAVIYNYNKRAHTLQDLQSVENGDIMPSISSPETMRKEFNRRYLGLRRSVAEERARINARILRAEVAGNETELAWLKDAKRRLNKLILQESTEGLLRKLTEPFQAEHERRADELEQLYILCEAQRMMLAADDLDLAEALQSVETTQTHLTKILNTKIEEAEDSLHLVRCQLNASNMLLRKMLTRAHHLAAVDVIDHDKRWEVVQERLNDEDTPEFTLRQVDNMNAVKETVSSAVRNIERIEISLQSLARPVLDIYATLKDCRLVTMIRMPADRQSDVTDIEDGILERLESLSGRDEEYEDAEEQLKDEADEERSTSKAVSAS